MDNRELKIIKPKSPRKTPPYRVFSTWEIHYACNYRCSYCHAPKPWHAQVRRAAYLNVEDWLRVWRNLYEEYGSWYILISGGEPSIYPDFTKLAIELSRMHFVELCTNLSWEVETFIKHANPKMVKVGTSFHPEFADLDKFLKKAKLLKEHGFNPIVNFVPYPQSLPLLSKYKNSFEEASLQFVLQPFIGDYQGRRYPQGYTESEREYFKIFKDDCNINTLDFKTTAKSNATKGRPCRMGENYAFIHPDGEAHRCCKDKTFSLGNIIQGTFRLLDEPAACNAEECNCHRCMLAGNEEEWSRNWASPDKGAAPDVRLAYQDSGIKVALIQCPAWGIFEPPVGLAQLSGCLRKAGFELKVFDFNIELYRKRKEAYKTSWAIEQSSFWCDRNNIAKFISDNPELIDECIAQVIEFNPQAVGFSVNNASLFLTLEFARMIKERKPDIKIILGGPMFLVPADLDSVMHNGYIDTVILGEGEETLIELVERWAKKQDLSQCKGIAYKSRDRIIKTEPRPLIRELDQLPYLDFTDLPLDRYDPPGHLGKHISLMTSRGCIQNCVFCGPRAYWPGYRSMSGRRVYEELKYHIQKHPEIEHIEFLDLLLNGNMDNLTELCDLMIAHPLKTGLRWHANAVIRPEMTAEVFLKMKKAGCTHLTYGIESGSQRVLDLMRKRYRVEDADKVLRYNREAGIEASCNFMFGFPGETEDDFLQTLEFLKRNRNNITTAYPSRAYCTIEPHSYLQQHMEEFGMLPNPLNNCYWESQDGENTYPERMRRCDVFSSTASSLGISVGLGLQTSIELDRCYNLGFYYESKNDYQKAAEYFSRYLRLDPKNETIIDRLGKIRQNNSIAPVQQERGVSFNWDIHWVCNYRCPYCWFYNRWPELRKYNRILDVKELLEPWERIYNRYGAVKLAITGGEPFVYPKFGEFIGELSGLHRVEIITNLSTDIKEFSKSVNPANVKVNPSFHPLFADFDEFAARACLLKEKGILQCVSYVAWPPQISAIPHYADKFNKYGITISLQSFFGEYKGLRYPDGYTEEEKKLILPQIGERGGQPFQTEPLKTAGKLCAAGYKYGVIHPDGTVLRCGGMDSSNGPCRIGNIFEKDFRLADKPSPCTFGICPCNEWAFLLDEKTS